MTDGAADSPKKPPRVSPVIPLTIATGFFMEGFSGTVLTTSLPQIARSLGVSPVQMSFAITSYILSLAVFIPISGWIADRFGARKVYCTALLAFTAGSTLCGVSNSLGMLIAMRVLQGFGGAMMTPVGRLILVRSFEKEQLILAMNYMSIPAMIGPLVGPVIGGFITTYLSWHWVFFVNIPIGLLAIVLTLRLIEDVQMARPPAFDVKGFFIMGLGLALAQLSFEYVGRPILPVLVQAGLFGAMIAALLGYCFHALRHPNPVIDLGLFRVRTFSVCVGAGSQSRIGLMTMGFLMPLLLQVGFGYDPVQSGLMVGVLTLGSMSMRVGIPRLLRAVGLPRVLLVNAFITSLMLMGLALLQRATPVWAMVSYLFIFGFLQSVQFIGLNALGFADLPPERMGPGTSIFGVAQRLSQSMGIGIAATLLSLNTVGGKVTSASFLPVFLVLGSITLTSLWGYSRLAPTDGAQLTGHHVRARSPRRRAAAAGD